MIKAVTGTKDILPADIPRWKYLEKTVEKILSNFNYKEIRTPIFEETSLFARGIGEETDIVGKEMYTFTDRSDSSLTLKPEMTAAVVRAYVEHSLGAQQPLVKLFYISPMFRQERPQAGRFRQFHQFGAEAIGSKSPLLDAEMIEISYYIFRQLELKDIKVKINSLGVTEDREIFRRVIREYLSDKIDSMSEDSRRRYNNNVLRIFDSKKAEDKAIMQLAPKMTEYLSTESRRNFDIVKNYLERINIPFEVDHTLFRGLDYYTETTFEIVSGSVGAQSALCGGGRYDLLIENLGGSPTPATGFAAGIERILLALKNEHNYLTKTSYIDVYLVRLDDHFIEELFQLASFLRTKNLSVDLDYLNRSVKAQMREANKINARVALFLGGPEYRDGRIKIKDMISSEEQLIRIKDERRGNFVISELKMFLNKERGLCMYQTQELGSCHNKVKTGIKYCKKHDFQLPE